MCELMCYGTYNSKIKGHKCSKNTLPTIFIAGSLESANSSILAQRRLFKEVVG